LQKKAKGSKLFGEYCTALGASLGASRVALEASLCLRRGVPLVTLGVYPLDAENNRRWGRSYLGLVATIYLYGDVPI
jgi:hypothetical protein